MAPCLCSYSSCCQPCVKPEGSSLLRRWLLHQELLSMLAVVLSCPQAGADCAGTASSGQSALEGGLPVHAAQLMAGPCMALYTSPPVCEPQAGVELVLEGVTKDGLAALACTCGVATLQEAQGWSHSPISMPDMQGAAAACSQIPQVQGQRCC